MTPAGAMRVQLSAPDEDVWVRVRPDGQKGEQLTLQQGEAREYDITEKIILSIGRVQSLRISINGRSVDFAKLLSNPKAISVKDVVITKDNYQQFLN
jgi:hypothetical protein